MIVLKPREEADLPVSERTLRGMDEAMRNLRAGIRSPSVDFEELAALVDRLELHQRHKDKRLLHGVAPADYL